MMQMKLTSIALLVTSLSTVSYTLDQTLDHVTVVIRHGYRSPLFTYPTDPYPYTNHTIWPEGEGMLTKAGKVQMYKIGQMLRRRYSNFLGGEMTPSDVRMKVYSNTNSTRVYSSAIFLLSGLKNPDKELTSDGSVSISEFSIENFTFPINEIFEDPLICPRFEKIRLNLLSKVIQEDETKKDLFKFLTKSSGMEIDSITKLHFIWDPLVMQLGNSFKPPDWALGKYKDLEEVCTKTITTLMGGTNESIIFTAGVLLGELQEIVQSKQKPLNFYVGHDLTLHSLSTPLKVGETLGSVLPGSALIFEVYTTPDGSSVVKLLFFGGDPLKDPIEVELPCGRTCSLTEFNNIIEPFVSRDWKDRCKTEV